MSEKKKNHIIAGIFIVLGVIAVGFIFLNSTNSTLGVISKARQSACVNTGYGLISAVEKDLKIERLSNDNYKYPTKITNINDLPEIRSELPEKVDLNLSNDGAVESGYIHYKDCKLKIENSKVEIEKE